MIVSQDVKDDANLQNKRTINTYTAKKCYLKVTVYTTPIENIQKTK